MDPVWERIFSEREWGKYPEEEVVRFVARNFYRVPDRSAVRMLEIGCGPGSGTSWYIAREGFQLTGVDGSPTAVAKARHRFATEQLPGSFVRAGVDRLPFADAVFDAVLDVVCLACNPEAATRVALAEVRRVLKPGGRHFSMTPRDDCWGSTSGTRLDATTVHEVADGPFARLGTTRFASRASLERLYADFHDLTIEYTVRSAGAGAREITHWVVTCRK